MKITGVKNLVTLPLYGTYFGFTWFLTLGFFSYFQFRILFEICQFVQLLSEENKT